MGAASDGSQAAMQRVAAAFHSVQCAGKMGRRSSSVAWRAGSCVAGIALFVHFLLWSAGVPHLGNGVFSVVPADAAHAPIDTVLADALLLDSKQSRCFVPRGLKHKTFATIVTLHAGVHGAYAHLIRANRLVYILKHGYRYCEVNSAMDPTRASSWNKIAVGLALLHTSPYMLMMDADALFVNNALRVEDVLGRHDPGRAVDLLMSSDFPGKPSRLNAGIWFGRRSRRTYRMLVDLYNRLNNADGYYEQAAFIAYLREREASVRHSASNAAAAAAAYGHGPGPGGSAAGSKGGTAWHLKQRRLLAAGDPVAAAAAAAATADGAAPFAAERAGAAAHPTVLIVDYKSFNLHRPLYHPGQEASEPYILHYAGSYLRAKEQHILEDAAATQAVNKSCTPSEAELGMALLVGDPMLRRVRASSAWHLSSWFLPRLMCRFKFFFYTGIWSKVHVDIKDEPAAASGGRVVASEPDLQVQLSVMF